MGANHIKFQLDVVTYLKESWFYWKIYWFCDTFQQLSIHRFPDNFPYFQQILINTYNDLRQ